MGEKYSAMSVGDMPRTNIHVSLMFAASNFILKSYPLQILFEDKDLLVINKPAGLSTESGNASHPSAEREAQADYAKRMQSGTHTPHSRHLPYLRAVHRLDRASSGVLVFAKSKPALSALMTQFEHREVEKIYCAMVEKAPPASSGVLLHWLKRDESGKRALVFDQIELAALPCESEYKIMETTGDTAILQIHPRTGRFHQIRAQLAHIGCPIVGDVLYGGQFWREHEIKLHALRLAFQHPRTATPMVIEAPCEWLAG